jgi:hypothetical protein
MHMNQTGAIFCHIEKFFLLFFNELNICRDSSLGCVHIGIKTFIKLRLCSTPCRSLKNT